jgi:hypothetical protein
MVRQHRQIEQLPYFRIRKQKNRQKRYGDEFFHGGKGSKKIEDGDFFLQKTLLFLFLIKKNNTNKNKLISRKGLSLYSLKHGTRPPHIAR